MRVDPWGNGTLGTEAGTWGDRRERTAGPHFLCCPTTPSVYLKKKYIRYMLHEMLQGVPSYEISLKANITTRWQKNSWENDPYEQITWTFDSQEIIFLMARANRCFIIPEDDVQPWTFAHEVDVNFALQFPNVLNGRSESHFRGRAYSRIHNYRGQKD